MTIQAFDTDRSPISADEFLRQYRQLFLTAPGNQVARFDRYYRKV